jgi:protease IV
VIRRRYLTTPGLLAAAIAGACAAGACDGRQPSSTETIEPAASSASASPRASTSGSGVLAELDFTRGVPEEVSTPLFGSAPRRSHLDLARVLGSLDASPSKGLFIRLGSATIGLAGSQEIGARLGALRKRGVPIVCHADGYENSTLLLAASGCSRIWVSPAGGVDSIGLAAQLLYARSLLDRLHVAVDFLQIGKYKGAEEPFTRDGPSPEARESLQGALRGMRAAWLDGITQGRGKPGLADVVEDGPFTPEDALEKGLIDAVGYVDEARDDAKKLAGVEQVVTRFGNAEGSPTASRGLVGVLRSLGGSGAGGAPHIAVVPAIGSISMGGTPSLPIGGGSEGISERELGRVLVRLAKESSVKAVVIRIDSPGGSALASDLLWKRLMELREKKPLVFSVGNMAASGGYYMASTGTKIVADPTSLIGSIGVVGGKLAVGKALEEFGVHAETIPASPDPSRAARSSYLSPFTPWDGPTREKVRATMTSVYELFLRRVAEGRKTTVAKVAPFAEGRVFGGVEAKARGMIDELGGFEEALALAQKLAGVPEDTPFEITADGGGLFDLLETGDASANGGGDSKAEGAARRVAQEVLVPEWTGAMPAVGAFVGSMTPLLRGERALAALPFGVVIK